MNIGYRLPVLESDKPLDGRLIKDADYSTSDFISVEDMPVNSGELIVYYDTLLGLPKSTDSYIWYQYDAGYNAVNTGERNILHFDDIAARPHFNRKAEKNG